MHDIYILRNGTCLFVCQKSRSVTFSLRIPAMSMFRPNKVKRGRLRISHMARNLLLPLAGQTSFKKYPAIPFRITMSFTIDVCEPVLMKVGNLHNCMLSKKKLAEHSDQMLKLYIFY